MRMCIQGGNLRVDRADTRWKGGRGAVEHCIAQVPVMRELARLCGLDEATAEKLCMHCAVHDWGKNYDLLILELNDKAMELDPQEKEDEAKDIELMRRNAWDMFVPGKLQLDEKLLTATNPRFHKEYAHSTFEERLMFYVDDLFEGSNPVDPLERIKEVAPRRAELDADPANNTGDRTYWEQERHIVICTEQEIFDRMQEHARASGQELPIRFPEEIPGFLRKIVANRIMDFGEAA